MERVYQTATKAGHTLCPMQFVPKAPYNIANTSGRDTDKFWDRKKCSPNKIHVADSLWVRELGDVVDRVLPHGIFDTSEDTQIRDFPKSRNWCVLELFLYLAGSVMGAWRARFLQEPTSLTLLKCKYQGNYFLINRMSEILETIFLKPKKLFPES